MPEQPREPLISPKQLAEYLSVPVKTVYEWNSRGIGPSYQVVGKHVRYRLEDVDVWLSARLKSPAA